MENTKFTLKPFSKQTPNRTKKETQPLDKSSRLHLCFLCFLHAEPPPPLHRSPKQNNFKEERVLTVPSPSSSGVVPSFACPNLHHTTHWSSPPQSLPELCVELGNKPEPPWATIQRFVFHDFPFSPIWILNWVFRFFCLLHRKVSNFEHFLFDENGGWVYVHILYCSNERCCVGFWYDLEFVWFLN